MITAKELVALSKIPFQVQRIREKHSVVRSSGPGTDQGRNFYSFYSREPREARLGRGAAGGRARGTRGAAPATPARLPDPGAAPVGFLRGRQCAPRSQPGSGTPPRGRASAAGPVGRGVRSRVAGAGKGRRTSDSGVVPAGVVAAGVVPPGVVPTDILRISPRGRGPSSPRQQGRGRRRESGERIPPRRGFRVGTWAPPGEGRGGGGAGAGAGAAAGSEPGQPQGYSAEIRRSRALNHRVEKDSFLSVRVKARRKKKAILITAI